MRSAKQSPTKLALYELQKLRRKASTRVNLYRNLAEKYGIKESSIRAAASKAGLTSKSTSLKYTFSERERKKHL